MSDTASGQGSVQNDQDDVTQSIHQIRTFAGTLTGLQQQLDKDLKGFNDNKEAIDKSILDFNTRREAADKVSQALNTTHDALLKKLEGLNKTCEDMKTTLDHVTGVKTNSDKLKASIDEFLKEITQSKATFETLKSATQTQSTNLKTEQEALQKLLVTVRKDHGDIVSYRQELLDDKKDDKGNAIPSVKSELASLFKNTEDKFDELSKFQTAVQSKFVALESDLKGSIEALLPGAGAAGLASAYFDAKARYGWVPFRSDTKSSWRRKFEYALYFIGGCVRYSVNHILFIAPLVGIVWLFVDLLDKHVASPAGTSSGWDSVAAIPPTVILFRVLLSVPLGFLTLFGYSSIQLNRRLFEEYNHKQRAMQTYHSFEKEIEEADKPELKERLTNIMLNVVDDKPALSMSEHQRYPDITKSLEVVSEALKEVNEAIKEVKKPGKI